MGLSGVSSCFGFPCNFAAFISICSMSWNSGMAKINVLSVYIPTIPKGRAGFAIIKQGLYVEQSILSLCW